MSKAELVRFAVPQKKIDGSASVKKKTLYAQISNSKVAHNNSNKNSYRIPDRFARARFLCGKENPYRSRAAFKLLEIENKYRICATKKRILDLGAAPGSWLQVALKAAPNARILGIDQKEILPFQVGEGAARVTILQEKLPENNHLNSQNSQEYHNLAQRIVDALGGKPQCILSDLAPNTIGQAKIDNDRHAMLVESIMPLVNLVLEDGGDFLAKLRHSAYEKNLLQRIKARFKYMQLLKPQASRKSANEIYLLARKANSPAASAPVTSALAQKIH